MRQPSLALLLCLFSCHPPCEWPPCGRYQVSLGEMGLEIQPHCGGSHYVRAEASRTHRSITQETITTVNWNG
ncbi:hypothetical protein LZ31DRAFT_381721 [Colletotrichum somersetense]|nr:hypothetical protein LZ31DRAFT_381721 [Colletotrichum somersetense]